jgi:peroxiredoxin
MAVGDVDSIWAWSVIVRAAVMNNKVLSGGEFEMAIRAGLPSLQPEEDAFWGNRVPMALADRRFATNLARNLVLRYDSTRRSGIHARRNTVFRSEGDYINALSGLDATRDDALGWIDFNEGHDSIAIALLTNSLDVRPRNPNAHYHLGRILEDKDPERAEQQYMRGFLYEDDRSEHLNREALSRLHPGKSTTELRKLSVDSHQAAILAERIIDGPRLATFDLTTVDGRAVSSRDLAGRVSVVHVWGTWCGPCVREAGDVERFYNQIRADSSIAFISISTGDTPAAVRDFMENHKYHFPVAVDGKAYTWANKAAVARYPTTFFVDKSGKIAYIVGTSENLLEEYGWRISSLQEKH